MLIFIFMSVSCGLFFCDTAVELCFTFLIVLKYVCSSGKCHCFSSND